MKLKALVPSLGVALAVMGVPAIAQAEPLEPIDRFFVSLGAYRANNDVKLRWDPSSGDVPGAHLDAKRHLGLDLDGTEPVFEIGGAFGHGDHGHRHRLTAFHYGRDATSSLTLTDDFQIGDDLYVEGADFEGDLEIKLLGVAYTWFFHNDGSSAFGVGVGAIRYEVSAAFAAAALIDEEIDAVSGSVSESNWVPQIHAEYVRSLSEHWRVALDASYVKKNGGGLSGDVLDFGARVDYFPWRHFGFSLGYNYNDLDLDFKRTRFTGSVDVKTHGPQLMATYRF